MSSKYFPGNILICIIHIKTKIIKTHYVSRETSTISVKLFPGKYFDMHNSYKNKKIIKTHYVSRETSSISIKLFPGKYFDKINKNSLVQLVVFKKP